MSDKNSKLKQSGIYIDASDIDISFAQIDAALSKVWSDDAAGEISVSVERIFFDSLLEISARYLEPHGYALNLENLLATIDSMRIGVTANVSSKLAADGRPLAKKIMPSVYMHLPKKKVIGPLLQRFYDEIEKYESALTRLQESEAKSKKAADAAIRDDSGRKTVELLRQENESLKAEIVNLSQRLAKAEDAFKAVPTLGSENQLPVGVRSAIVKSVRTHEGTAQLKVNDSQFSVPLKQLGGIPTPNARALCFYESGILKHVWVFDPSLQPFEYKIAEIMAVDGQKVKIKFPDRSESVFHLSDGENIPKIRGNVLVKFAHRTIIDFELLGEPANSDISDRIFEQQTRRQISE